MHHVLWNPYSRCAVLSKPDDILFRALRHQLLLLPLISDRLHRTSHAIWQYNIPWLTYNVRSSSSVSPQGYRLVLCPHIINTEWISLLPIHCAFLECWLRHQLFESCTVFTALFKARRRAARKPSYFTKTITQQTVMQVVWIRQSDTVVSYSSVGLFIGLSLPTSKAMGQAPFYPSLTRI